MKRNSVIPTPQNATDDVVVSFIDEENGGRLHNVTLNDKVIADAFKAHQAELDALAAQYTVQHKAITDKRAAIETQAFVAAEAILAADAEKRRLAREAAVPTRTR